MATWSSYVTVGHTGPGLLAQVSALYYIDGRTQADIAQRLGLSRVKVSRLLCAAREAGIARIVVNPPRGVLVALESELESRFALREVRIVPTSLDEPPESTRRQLGVAAAADLARSLRAGHTVGLVGADLLATMIDAVAPMDASEVRVVQGVGWEHAQPPQRTLLGLVLDLARRIHGSAVVLPVPSVVDSEEIRRNLESDPQINDALRALDELETLYTEIAPSVPDVALARKAPGSLGHIAHRHFDCRGRMLGTAADGHVVGLTIEQLRRARHVVALAHGPAQAAVIAAAMRTGLVGTLITDELTARAIAALPSSHEETS
ncbi:MAG: sugar-binding transcriptional regulator [Gemmatimonadaceae bacterium]